jgi:hypothetical protein
VLARARKRVRAHIDQIAERIDALLRRSASPPPDALEEAVPEGVEEQEERVEDEDSVPPRTTITHSSIPTVLVSPVPDDPRQLRTGAEDEAAANGHGPVVAVAPVPVVAAEPPRWRRVLRAALPLQVDATHII